MVQYRTKDGDMLDWICWRHYGRQAHVVEAVLEANPGLADLGNILPPNYVISLPNIELPKSNEMVRLWD